jgi:phosphoribosyl 1,2-cyclic phosphate phosphodiesterase
MKVIILGSGTSQGVPIIGCSCKTCSSTNPKDKRLRVSAYLEIKRGELNASRDLKLLIDTSTDFRQQMLTNKLDDIDAVLYTHSHCDHIMGLDDVRPINYHHKKSIDIYGNRETIENIKTTFRYIWDPNTYQGGGIPKVKPNIIGLKEFEIYGVRLTPIEYYHGPSIVWGYRIGNFAYMTDCSRIPESEFRKLEGLKVLVLDALRYKPHETHFSIDEAVSVARRLGAGQTYFVHMTHDVMHDEANVNLPEGVRLAYDGLTLEV